MNKRELLQEISARINSRSLGLEDLAQIFEDYKSMVGDFAASGPEYGSALRHIPEEFPDLQRLIGRGHDAVFKGRLLDAVRALKQKIDAIEPPEIEQPDEPQAQSERERRVRNTPNLGME